MKIENKKKMMTVQFIGTRNKTDFVIYLAHVLSNLEKRVLIVDSTRNELYKNGFTRMSKGQFLYDFQGIDILCGTTNWLDIEECLLRSGESTVGYDVILVDMDTSETLEQEWPDFNERFYVGDFDRANQLRDAEMIRTLFSNTGNNELKRITFESTFKLDGSFFESMLDTEVQWRSMNYLFEPDDLAEGLRHQMQHDQTIPYKKLNKQYKELLSEIVSALYEMHVKDVSDAVKPSIFKIPFKRKKEVTEFEGSKA
ncbi:hypothetical protein V6B14_22255 (plasmid) [Sporosarcina psychrophila]|uniref:hypothetical protein n=1 Tax=Sporosarcina psychrophila TaxID=1476 RepID=UPI0030CB37FB